MYDLNVAVRTEDHLRRGEILQLFFSYHDSFYDPQEHLLSMQRGEVKDALSLYWTVFCRGPIATQSERLCDPLLGRDP